VLSERTVAPEPIAGHERAQSALAADVSWTRLLDDFVRHMPSGAWIGSFSAQINAAPGAAGTAKTTASNAAAAGSAAPAAGIGTLQVSVTGLDFPDAADWLRTVADAPSLSGVTISGVTKSSESPAGTVGFTSTATITPAARSDRATWLAKAAL
jgi:hypothetical protein